MRGQHTAGGVRSSGETGSVLYRCRREPAAAPSGDVVAELIRWRQKLYRAGLIGVGRDGIGFGNLSCRVPGSDSFIVSGTATGALARLDAEHFVLVTDVDFNANSLDCRGRLDASSEALTHAAAYLADEAVGGVVHVHHAALWRRLRGRIPTTPAAASAGTPALAQAVEALLGEHALSRAGTAALLIVLGGHTDGMLAVGRTVADAAALLLHSCAAPAGPEADVPD